MTAVSPPAVSALFVNYNAWGDCLEAVRSLLAHPPRDAAGAPMPLEIVVVDNASTESAPPARAALETLLASANGRLILHEINSGYAAGMNLAARHARGDYLLVSNPDVLFQPGCVDSLLRVLEQREDLGAAAPVAFWDRGLECRMPANVLPTLSDLVAVTLASMSPRLSRRYCRRRTRAALDVWTAPGELELRMLSGCCFLARRRALEDVRGFDERFPLYFEDTDLSRRLRRAGWRFVQVGGAAIVHLYDRTARSDRAAAMTRYAVSRRRYVRKWYGKIGAWLDGATLALARTEWAKRRAKIPPRPRVLEAATAGARPRLELPRRVERFVVEHAMDPCFYLAAGAFGSGDAWSPGDALLERYADEMWFRVVDATSSAREELGIWRWRRPEAAR